MRRATFTLCVDGDEIRDHRTTGSLADCRKAAAFFLSEMRGDGLSSPITIERGRHWRAGGRRDIAGAGLAGGLTAMATNQINLDPESMAGFLALYHIALKHTQGDHKAASRLVGRWYQGYYQQKNARPA